MSPLAIGALIGIASVVVLASGIPVAFGLVVIALAFLALFDGVGSLVLAGELFFSGLADFTLVSIPMFIAMGAAVAASPAGGDLYGALDRWLYRIPGGLAISNLGACALFAALSGSSPATCAAIGKMGIPEMRKRGYPDGLASGSIAAGGTLGILIPPSVTMIVYGISTGTSIGRLFIAGILPGLMLTALFSAWSMLHAWRDGFGRIGERRRFNLMENLRHGVRVLPFLLIVAGILYVLYGGVATPSEAAGVGAMLCLVMVAVVYRIWNPAKLWRIVSSSTRESVMIMMIIAAAALFSYMLSSLFVTQSIAQWIAEMEVNRWVLLAMINVFLLVAGFFLPPVAVILMTAPILMPIVLQAGFDPYWFAVVLTINMEIGLITPPVGLNLYVIDSIAPDVGLPKNLARRPALRAADGAGHRPAVHLPRHRHLAAGNAARLGFILDGIDQRSDFWNGHLHDISRLKELGWVETRPGAGGRAGGDDIAGLKTHEGRQVGNEIVERKQKVGRGVVLPHLAVHPCRQVQGVLARQFVRSDHPRAKASGAFEVLALGDVEAGVS